MNKMFFFLGKKKDLFHVVPTYMKKFKKWSSKYIIRIFQNGFKQVAETLPFNITYRDRLLIFDIIY